MLSHVAAKIRPGRYQHYKGMQYEVLGIARHSEFLDEMVVYRALYGNQELWVRPASMFVEMVELDGTMVPRFAYTDEGAEDR